jgi:thymidine kinase
MSNSSAAFAGEIHVISGCMASGKSLYLISLIEKYQNHCKVGIYSNNPYIESRYNNLRIPCRQIRSAQEIDLEQFEIYAFDEAQLFDEEIVKICTKLTQKGKTVYVSGLDLDYKSIPFSGMATLMALATTVTKLQAQCSACGKPASRSFRITREKQRVLLGKENYTPLCLSCYHKKQTE